MSLLLWLFTALYLLFLAWLISGWRKIKEFKPVGEVGSAFMTVLIPVRNEAENILNLLNDLNQQNWPKDRFEVLVIDDFSEDHTIKLVQAYSKKTELNLKVLSCQPRGILFGKKAALQTGIEAASGEIIVTTDADCRVKPEWLRIIALCFAAGKVRLLTGPVAFANPRNIFENMQQIEFATLVGSGAATLAHGLPSMCNGANLAFQRATFFDVNGYSGNENIASGDDEFLMHKIFGKYPGEVKFLKSVEAVVYTRANPDLQAFYQQRRRWASKWSYYNNWSTKYLAVFIFLYNFSFLFFLGMTIQDNRLLYPFLIAAGLKITGEFVFLHLIEKVLAIRLTFVAFLLVEIFYPFYVSFFGILSKWGKYSWKGRELK